MSDSNGSGPNPNYSNGYPPPPGTGSYPPPASGTGNYPPPASYPPPPGTGNYPSPEQVAIRRLLLARATIRLQLIKPEVTLPPRLARAIILHPPIKPGSIMVARHPLISMATSLLLLREVGQVYGPG